MFKSLYGSAVEFAGGLDFHPERGSGGPHRLDERLHPEDGDHPLQIVGENVKAHLRAGSGAIYPLPYPRAAGENDRRPAALAAR
jgi:hypothetical protein